MTKEELREALECYVDSYGINHRTGILTFKGLLAFAAQTAPDLPFATAAVIVLEVAESFMID